MRIETFDETLQHLSLAMGRNVSLAELVWDRVGSELGLETPGLGARIENDAWQALWPGKQVADAEGVIRIEVVKGAGAGPHEVDGITGATRTSTGVTNLLRFWLGPDGYGPYLERLRSESGR